MSSPRSADDGLSENNSNNCVGLSDDDIAEDRLYGVGYVVDQPYFTAALMWTKKFHFDSHCQFNSY